MNEEISFGANESHIDPRTISNTDVSLANPELLSKGGIDYQPSEILHQQ